VPGDNDSINVSIGGNVVGPIAVGKNITQTQAGRDATVLTATERQELDDAFATLRAQIAAAAPSETRDAALAQVAELEQAVNDPEPDPSRLQRVARWFARNLPTMGAAVATVLIHPVVGKLVGAAGDAAVRELGLDDS